MKTRFPWSVQEPWPIFSGVLSVAPGAPGDPGPTPAPGGGPVAPPAPAPPAPPTPRPEPEPEERWDEPRARELINRLRPFETQAKQLQAELATVQAQLKARTDAELSETERLQAQVKDLEAKQQEAQRQLADQMLQNAVITEARKLEFADDEDALAYVTLHASEIQRDASGSPTNIHALLKAAIEKKPHLKANAAPAHTQIPGTPRAQNPPAKAALEQNMEQQLRARGSFVPYAG